MKLSKMKLSKLPIIGKRTITAILPIILLLLLCTPVQIDALEFSGGQTIIKTEQGSKKVTLSGGASVKTDDVVLTSDTIELYGDNYSQVVCTGNVKAEDQKNGINFTSPNLFYDRDLGRITSDSWIEIQDTENQAALSGGWFEYDMENTQMKLQLMAKIIKVTEDSLMVCRADSIEYNGRQSTVTLKGNANVTWNNDVYKAAMIVVDLETNDIQMYGAISGELNQEN